jgi:hypothetical protein
MKRKIGHGAPYSDKGGADFRVEIKKPPHFEECGG